MCNCNTEIFRYTNISRQLIFERCGRTKEILSDTPKNKSCAGVWVPSKKVPCGLMRVMDFEENIIFEGPESDYFSPKKKIHKKDKKLVQQPKVIKVQDKSKSHTVQKWLNRYHELKEQEPEEKIEEISEYVNPIEGYESMTPKEKMRARLKLPKRKYKGTKKESSLSKLFEEMEKYSVSEFNEYKCAVMCAIITKNRSKEIKISEMVEIKKTQEEQEYLITTDISNESDEEEEEEEEEWSEEEEDDEEEEETGLEEDFEDFAINEESINF